MLQLLLHFLYLFLQPLTPQQAHSWWPLPQAGACVYSMSTGSFAHLASSLLALSMSRFGFWKACCLWSRPCLIGLLGPRAPSNPEQAHPEDSVQQRGCMLCGLPRDEVGQNEAKDSADHLQDQGACSSCTMNILSLIRSAVCSLHMMRRENRDV